MAILRSISAVRIFVNDLDKARYFYGNMLELAESESGPGYLSYEIDNAMIVVEALAADDPERDDLIGRFVPVSFTIDGDAEATYQRLLDKGVAFLQPPEKQEWGGTLIFPCDTDGNVFTLVG